MIKKIGMNPIKNLKNKTCPTDSNQAISRKYPL